MKTVEWVLETGLAGVNHSGSFEISDDATEEEIEECVDEEVMNCISWNWWVKD